MPRKSPSKPVKSPLKNPPETVKTTASIPSTSSEDGKESQLAALLKESEAGQPGVEKPADPTPPPVEEVPEVYRRIVYPLSLGFSVVMDKGLRRFNHRFEFITKDQAATFEEDAAFCIKGAIDGFLPQFAKDHPRLTALVLSVGTICVANIRKIEPEKEPARPASEPVKTAAGPMREPVSGVVVDTAEGRIGPGGEA